MTPAAESLALESLLAFWADAGVDACLSDEPTDKLARRAPPSPAPTRAVPAPVGNPSPVATRSSAGAEAAVDAAAALAGSAGDLAALEAVLRDWDGGGLRPAGARQVFFARGVAPARIVAVGDAPGAEEEAAGQAFAGAAGRLLDRMLAAAGVGDQALRLHVVPWRPPGDRPPSADEGAAALPFVRRAIGLANPSAVLVLGDTAARLLLGRAEGVLKLRGGWLDNLSQPGGSEGPQSLVTFGPAFLLKQPRMKAQAWADLLRLAVKVADR